MKLLYITDNDILGHGGGAIGSLKYYDAIKFYADNTHSDFKVVSLNQNVPEALDIIVKKTKNIDKLVRIYGHSTYMYHVFKENKTILKDFKPDVVLLGRSRLGFIAKFFKKINPSVRVITFFENIEYDYVDGYFSQLNGIKKEIFKTIEKIGVSHDERDAIEYSDKIVFLTKRDAYRARTLYCWNKNNYAIIPICLKKSQRLSKKTNKKTVAFVGSLDYDSNLSALKIFINDVWNPYFANNMEYQFLIAGSRPKKYLYDWVRNLDNISVVANFDKLEDVLPIGSMMIAPIEKGAGMKVKVADTLSMGLAIAASDEALVGYEKAIEGDHLHAIMRCNTPNEYIAAIKKYFALTDQVKENIFKQNTGLFNEFYTFDVARAVICHLIDELSIARKGVYDG